MSDKKIFDRPADCLSDHDNEKISKKDMYISESSELYKDSFESLARKIESLQNDIQNLADHFGLEAGNRKFMFSGIHNDAKIKHEKELINLAKATYQNRRSREKIFGETDLFAEPAWDILLDLYIAQLSNKAISITSACIAACVPPTTALRWISELESLGFVQKETDDSDRRRTFVRLTASASSNMRAYFIELMNKNQKYTD